MKQYRYVLATLALACAVFLLPGCQVEEDDDGGFKELPPVSLASADGIKYYSLSTGAEVTGDDINTNKWDIAFTRTRLVLTNSGATATGLSSGGDGGVWYTDKIVLSDASLNDRKAEGILEDYTTDQKRYVLSMGSTPAEPTLNIMSYVGYDNEGTKDGLSSGNCLQGYSYNKKQYYNSPAMGQYGSTNQVYIIRHGDGVHFSKIQIVYEYVDSKDNWAVSYQNF
ncbi:MAG: HmuY family protein [Treponema sp.]|jgi:hypothetical protein|nr:HmuY family protein [Treponema sp.]